MKKTLFLLSVFTLLILVAANCGDNTMAGGKDYDNGKVPDPGGDFEYDRVSVVLTEEASMLDKVWVPSDFPEFAFSEIENKGLIGSKAYLNFHLTEPSRDNVLKAIYKLRARTEVYSAELSWIGTFGLDPAIETQIKQDWLEQFGTSLSIPPVNYYGTHNGYVAFFWPLPDTILKHLMIAGVIFRYGSDWEIYLWKDGSFYDMVDAYEQGLIDSDNISQIGDFHRESMKQSSSKDESSFNEWYFNTDTVNIIID